MALIHREDARISRATVYRTLQWMVDAGMARKVDFGEGRFRFEHSYRHPRHFHLICKSCNRSSEFLSSDIEALIEEIAAARGFAARQSVLQIYGTCEQCRSGGVAGARAGDQRDGVRARRDPDRDRHRAERPRVLLARREGDEERARPARSSRNSPRRSATTCRPSRRATRRLLEQDPELESRPTFLFFKGAANGLFAAGADEIRRGSTTGRR